MRGLSEKFILDLTEGELSPFLQLVHEDDSLCLEIRENYINIYYRGGNIAKIEETPKGYRRTFNINYTSRYSEKIQKVKVDDFLGWIEVIPYVKMEMDWYFHKNPKSEREFQQLILRENNCIKTAKSTDYYIADIEYANTQNGSRFDMLGVKWISRASERRTGKGTCLSFMEVKYGNSALTGNAGLQKHICDMYQFLTDQNLYENIVAEVRQLFSQKVTLGLLEGIHSIEPDLSKPPEFLLLLANHKPSSKILRREIEEIIPSETYQALNEICDVKVAKASFLGYGLYNECLDDLEVFL